MATIYHPRDSIRSETPDRWRGNQGRRGDGMLNLRVQPAIGYERRRGGSIGVIVLSGLVFILALGLIQLFSPSAAQGTQPHALLVTPVVTIQIIGASTALPVMNMPVNEPVQDVSAIVTMSDVSGFVTVRSGPGPGYDSLGTLPSGQTATLIGRSADNLWWLIAFQGRIGWVDTSHTHFEGDLAQVPVADVQ
jgi:uncharacterized protein YraI